MRGFGVQAVRNPAQARTVLGLHGMVSHPVILDELIQAGLVIRHKQPLVDTEILVHHVGGGSRHGAWWDNHHRR